MDAVAGEVRAGDRVAAQFGVCLVGRPCSD